MGRPTSAAYRPRRRRARSFTKATAPSASTTSWAVGFTSSAASRMRECSDARCISAVRLESRGQHPLSLRRPRRLARDAPLQVDGHERLRVRHQRLGTTEKEDSALVQREVEAAEDPALRFGVEIHQRIPPDQHVDAGNRRVVDEVVVPEDHLPAEGPYGIRTPRSPG